MSVFRVKLQHPQQGLLDVNPLTGKSVATSIQRTISVAGPNGITRVLKDGQTFTDSNYWKQFAYPQLPLDQAFIEVVTDDGSVFSYVESENVYPVVWKPGTAGVIGAGDAPTDTNMTLDIVDTYGSPAMFVQIKNEDSSNPIKVKLNGSTNAVLTVAASTHQIFNYNDLVVTKLEFDNSASGTSEVDYVEVILSVKSKSNS